jgi:hypothetical protein
MDSKHHLLSWPTCYDPRESGVAEECSEERNSHHHEEGQLEGVASSHHSDASYDYDEESYWEHVEAAQDHEMVDSLAVELLTLCAEMVAEQGDILDALESEMC